MVTWEKSFKIHKVLRNLNKKERNKTRKEGENNKGRPLLSAV